MAKPRSIGKPPEINGFVNLYKPPGITSMDALRQIKRITGQRKKVGHCGTMDPLARGVLPVCFGQATRLMDYVVRGRKMYRVEISLGIDTTTYDAEGEVVKTRNATNVTRDMVEESIQPWIGVVQQTPPMYSAIKVDGERLYKLARSGVEVKRESRPIEIHSITVIEFNTPTLILDIECGRGTYIRSLAHDLGESLGCGGHVTDLVRLLCGGFTAEYGTTLGQLEEAAVSPEGWQKYLFPVDRVLRNLKSVFLSKNAEENIMHGQAVKLEHHQADVEFLEEHRAYNDEGAFVALVRFDKPTNLWHPTKVFTPGPPSPYAPTSV